MHYTISNRVDRYRQSKFQIKKYILSFYLSFLFSTQWLVKCQKKVLAKSFWSEQNKETPKVMYPQLTPLRKIANLERIINEIREEATIRNNIRLLSDFHKKYIEEIGRIKMIKENEIKVWKKRKKNLKTNWTHWKVALLTTQKYCK